MKYGVLISSAINTKFGVYSSQQRLAQTLETIKSVRQHIPNATIFLVEMAGIPLDQEQKSQLEQVVDKIIDFTSDPDVVGLFNSTDNWDVVKNVTEVLCFRNTLHTLVSAGIVNNFDRFFKVSGRYLVTDAFDVEYYQSYKVQPFIVVGNRKHSQFPISVTGVEKQFMTRLWSWPAAITKEIVDVYDQSLRYMYTRLAAGGYADIEHCLFKFLDHEKIIEKSPLGIRGNISPNGVQVED